VLAILDEPPLQAKPTLVPCPICVANGYASARAEPDKPWFATANSVGGALWYSGLPRVQVGVGYHGSSRAVRALASFRAWEARGGAPAVNLGYGFQSQETGATGFSATAEWQRDLSSGTLHFYGGLSIPVEDSRVRPVGGFRYAWDEVWAAGVQYDGNDPNPFVNRSFGPVTLGVLWVATRSVTATIGYRF